MSASLGDAPLFVTRALGAAIKRQFIFVSYSVSSDNFNLQGKKCQYSITNKVLLLLLSRVMQVELVVEPA